MNIDRHNKTAFNGNLEDVFIKVFSVGEIRLVYDFFFYKIKKRAHPPKKATKPNMVAALVRLSEAPEDFNLFVKTLPQKVQKAYELLLWQDSISLDKAQESLGFEIVCEDAFGGSWSRQKYVMKEAFPFIALIEVGYSRYDHQGLENFAVSIPPAIRKWLKPHFPKPTGYEIQPLSSADLAKLSGRTFDASPTITADLGQLADFLKRGTVARTKKGDYTKSSIRKADGLTESGDWYPADKSKPSLALMRHEMLLDFIEGFDAALANELTAPAPKPAVFKDILTALHRDEDMLAKWLLAHLQHRHKYYDETYHDLAIAELFALFKCLQTDMSWVSTDNLKSVQFYRDIDIRFFDTGKYVFSMQHLSRGYSYENTHELDQTYLQKVGTEPLIDGMAFLLAAFGFVEIAYQAPANDAFHTEKTPYLSRFDGALAVRLTDVGAYAFGLTSKLKLKQSSRKVATLHLHPEQLHITCRDLDPITELTLKEFMECLAPEFYRMTRTSILKGCQTPKQVSQRIASFRKRMPGELPQNWKDFLSSLEAEKSALQPERGLSVFNLAGRPELQRQFMQDPILRRLSLRVEGHRIAIDLKDLTKVRIHLRKLGYLVESS